MLQIQVALSLVGILTGLVVLYRLLFGIEAGVWTIMFLATTILTSLTGFPLPPYGFDPPRIVGILSLVLLAVAVVALYGFQLRGVWRWLYCFGAIAALYLNVFVGVVQSFQKIPLLHALAPTQSEGPFLVTQVAVLAVFVGLGLLAVRNTRPALGGMA